MSLTTLLSLTRSSSTVVFASALKRLISSLIPFITSFCCSIQALAAALVLGPTLPSATLPIVVWACLICSCSPLAICPSTFDIVAWIFAMRSNKGCTALLSTPRLAIFSSYSLALFSNLTISSLILVS